jgi:hypothetical protein
MAAIARTDANHLADGQAETPCGVALVVGER